MVLPLIFEIDGYLRRMKFFRFLSLMGALIDNTVYFVSLAIWLYQIYNPPTWLLEQWSIMTVFINMVLAYNFLFDSMNVPINTTIIIKEFSMEFF